MTKERSHWTTGRDAASGPGGGRAREGRGEADLGTDRTDGAGPGAGLSGAVDPSVAVVQRVGVTDVHGRPVDLARWGRLRRAALATPNNDPGRFALTAALQREAEPHVSVLEVGGEEPAMILGRVQRRRMRLRVGYAPLPTPETRVLDVVYGGLLPGTHEAGRRAVLEELQRLLADREVDAIEVHKVPMDDPLFAAVAALPRAVVQETRPHWIRELHPDGFDATMSCHSKNHRKKLNRLERRLCEAGDGSMALVRITTPDDWREHREGIISVARQSYQHQLDSGISVNRVLEDLLLFEAETGRVRSYLLYVGGRPVTFQLGFLDDGVYHCEGTAYDADYAPNRPGTVLLINVIRDLCEIGARIIDYGFGDAEYKSLYGTSARDEATVHLYGSGVRARTTAALDRGARGIMTTARRMDRSGQLFKMIRKKWRRRLQ